MGVAHLESQQIYLKCSSQNYTMKATEVGEGLPRQQGKWIYLQMMITELRCDVAKDDICVF